MRLKKPIDFASLLTNLFIAQAVGFLSGFLANNIFEKYESMVKPEFALPGFLFPIIWVILYFLMGFANYLARENKKASCLYYMQLIINFLWPIFFFGLDLKFFSLIWLLILFIMILATTKEFFKTNFLSGLLMLPYIIWSVYALYLNFEIWQLN